MALIQFNTKTLELQVKVGVIEEYKPDKEIKRLHKKSEDLKKKVEGKLVEIFGEGTSPTEINEMLKKDLLREKWMDFISKEYDPELEALLESIDKKNEKICPGYKELRKNSQTK